MDNKLNIWIHCRVSNESERILLEFQKKKVMEFLNNLNVNIFGVSQEVNSGKDPHSRALDAIKVHARRGDIDAVIVTDKTRLFISENHYQEFKLMCEMCHVQIIELQESENFLQNFLFEIFS